MIEYIIRFLFVQVVFLPAVLRRFSDFNTKESAYKILRWLATVQIESQEWVVVGTGVYIFTKIFVSFGDDENSAACPIITTKWSKQTTPRAANTGQPNACMTVGGRRHVWMFDAHNTFFYPSPVSTYFNCQCHSHRPMAQLHPVPCWLW